VESRKSEASTLELSPPLRSGLLERLFKLSLHGTTVKTELIAGLTTFITMAYIIFVNPNIMADAGLTTVRRSSPLVSPPHWAAC
jgi:AGZA family xanthine/uracil permease-like MFS transporter